MQLRRLGKSDLKISPILMGTWQAGKDMWVGIDDAQTTSAIRAAFEAGITTLIPQKLTGKGIQSASWVPLFPISETVQSWPPKFSPITLEQNR